MSMNSQKLNHVGEQIVMRQHDALRFARCAGAARQQRYVILSINEHAWQLTSSVTQQRRIGETVLSFAKHKHALKHRAWYLAHVFWCSYATEAMHQCYRTNVQVLNYYKRDFV